MTEEQKRNWKNNLLMYLETCMVDHGGSFRWNKIGDDEVFLDEYKEEGLINYERLPFKEIEKNKYNLGPAGPFTHLITKFTDESWEKATKLRRERASRLSQQIRTVSDPRPSRADEPREAKSETPVPASSGREKGEKEK